VPQHFAMNNERYVSGSVFGLNPKGHNKITKLNQPNNFPIPNFIEIRSVVLDIKRGNTQTAGHEVSFNFVYCV